MENQLIRLFILILLVFLLTSDIKDLLDALSTTATVGPYLSNWRSQHQAHARDNRPPPTTRSPTIKSRQEKRSLTIKNNVGKTPDQLNGLGEGGEAEGELPAKFFTPIANGRRKLKSSERSIKIKRINPDDIFASLSDDEKQELLAMRSQMTKTMQEWCLPKLVCELHAGIGDRTGRISEAEQGLLSIIKETSMNPMGEVISKYHFAAHMGQLLANVEGNGCHNLYPSCPLSGPKVLQMVKRVRIK